MATEPVGAASRGACATREAGGELGVVAVQDRAHMQACVRDRRADRVQRHERRNAPGDVSRDRRAELRRAEVAVAEVVARGHQERRRKREGTDHELPARACPQAAAGEGGEHREDRERREQQAVGRAVDDAAPEHGAGEREPVRSRGRILDAEHHHREERCDRQAECGREHPAAANHLAEGLRRRASPQHEEAEGCGGVDRVVEVALQPDPVGEEERDEKAEHEAAGEPAQLLVRHLRQVVGRAGAADCVDAHVDSFRGQSHAAGAEPHPGIR